MMNDRMDSGWLARWAVRSQVADRGGFALLATLLILGLVAALVITGITGAMSSTRMTASDYQDTRVFYAAEAGGEATLAQIAVALKDGFLADDELAAIHPPSLAGISFDSFAAKKIGASYVETITDGPFAGLYALTQEVDVYSRAATSVGDRAAVILGIKAQAIPIFQFGVFFEQDLEATNGPPMEFVGRVHSNGNIYLSSSNAWYRDMVTTPNKIFHDRKDHHKVLNGVFINDSNGDEVALDFDSRTHSSPDAFKSESCHQFDCRLQTDAFEVDSLRMPMPDGVPMSEVIRPREDSDTDSEREVKFAWNADMYVTVDLTNVQTKSAVCGTGTDATPWPTISVQRSAGKTLPTNAQFCNFFSWSWSAFYDGREQELKDILQIDIGQISAWVGADESRRTQLIYVDFIAPASIAAYPADVRDEMPDATLDPALRLVNGATLPNPMTIATEWPFYVRGNYNSVNKRPSAVAGDGVTILSNAWNDGDNRPGALVFTTCQLTVVANTPCPAYVAWQPTWSDRIANETTVNTALLAGHWPTPCDHEDPSCVADGTTAFYADWYGGGLENFPRFLETWNNGGQVTLHYVGALISPFTSQKTTGTWNGTYYSPPQRDWAFDVDFKDPSKLPPGTPNVGYVIRTAMREAY